jgi:hypothetical protein
VGVIFPNLSFWYQAVFPKYRWINVMLFARGKKGIHHRYILTCLVIASK